MPDEERVPRFALGLLTLRGRYVLQLRDDKPGIAAPGLWGFFGGRVHAEESPEEAFQREIREELDISPVSIALFWHVDRYSEFYERSVEYWIFVSDIADVWDGHVVREGQAAGVFAYEELSGIRMHPFVPEVLERHHDAAPG